MLKFEQPMDDDKNLFMEHRNGQFSTRKILSLTIPYQWTLATIIRSNIRCTAR